MIFSHTISERHFAAGASGSESAGFTTRTVQDTEYPKLQSDPRSVAPRIQTLKNQFLPNEPDDSLKTRAPTPARPHFRPSQPGPQRSTGPKRQTFVDRTSLKPAPKCISALKASATAQIP